MMKNHPYIADDDMHMGEYSQIGMDGLNNHEDTQYDDMNKIPDPAA